MFTCAPSPSAASDHAHGKRAAEPEPLPSFPLTLTHPHPHTHSALPLLGGWSKEEDAQLLDGHRRCALPLSRSLAEEWSCAKSSAASGPLESHPFSFFVCLSVCLPVSLPGRPKPISFGNKWTEIARMVTGRTDNAVKNRFIALEKRDKTARSPAPSPSSPPLIALAYLPLHLLPPLFPPFVRLPAVSRRRSRGAPPGAGLAGAPPPRPTPAGGEGPRGIGLRACPRPLRAGLPAGALARSLDD